MTSPVACERWLTGGANAGKALADMVPADVSGASRHREAYDHAIRVEGLYEAAAPAAATPVHPIPCYVCGVRVAGQLCGTCCRNLCDVCYNLGDHGADGPRCDFVIPGRMGADDRPA